MKHLVVGTLFFVLVVLSFTIGGICYLYAFKKEHFLKGTKFINKKVIKFSYWYDI
jgi:hypothetical protein